MAFLLGFLWISSCLISFMLNFTPTFAVINGLSIRYTSTNPEIAPIVRKPKQVVDDLYGDNFTAFEFPVALKLRSEEKKSF